MFIEEYVEKGVLLDVRLLDNFLEAISSTIFSAGILPIVFSPRVVAIVLLRILMKLRAEAEIQQNLGASVQELYKIEKSKFVITYMISLG